MTDSFSYNFDLNLSTPPKPEPQPLLALDYCSVTPLSSGMLLLRNKRTGKTGIIQAESFSLLGDATRFLPMDEHVRAIAAKNPRLQQQAIRNTLSTLVNNGLMIEARTVREAWQAGAETMEAPPAAEPTDVYVATTDRPESLQPLLQSFTEYAGDGFRFHVLDDSRQADARSRNRVLVEQSRERDGLPCVYYGETEDSEFADALKSALPDCAHAIDFLLGDDSGMGAITPGRSWNKGLLRSAGKRLVRVDDDVVCRYCRPPEKQDGVSITSRVREIEFLTDDDAWKNYLDPADPEPLREQVRHLGSPLALALRELASGGLDDDALSGLRSDEAHHIEARSPILLTACGSLGDPGIASNAWLYDLDGEDRARFVADAARYAEHKKARNVWTGRRRATLSARFGLISQITGIDNRTLLPPYFPWFRNEDFLFGNLLQLLHPGALMLELPWSVPHLPIPRRRWDEDAAETPAGLGFQQFLAEFLVRHRQVQAASVEGRWRLLVAALFDLAEASEHRLIELIEEQTCDMQADLIRTRERLVKAAGGEPEYWANDMQRSIRANLESLVQPRHSLISDFPQGLERSGQLTKFREFVARYASALEAWPRLREVATQMQR